MKRLAVFLFLFCLSGLLAAQGGYKFYVAQADSLFRRGEFRAAGASFSAAFEAFGWRGYSENRFTAARAWARADVPDSAFFQLNRLADKTDFLDDDAVLVFQTDLESLHEDLRWRRLLTKLAEKKAKTEALRANPLSLELESIHDSDQYFRAKRDSVLGLHGQNSPEMDDWNHRWIRQDSLNYLRVNEIMEKHGWLGSEQVTQKAAGTLWLVIQHAPLEAQLKWLPAMREAARAGKAEAGNLAYLEDRVLMRQGKPQRYGSQITSDKETGAWVLWQVEDPEHLDERRASVGLGPIAVYLENTGAVWKQ